MTNENRGPCALVYAGGDVSQEELMARANLAAKTGGATALAWFAGRPIKDNGKVRER